MGYRFVGIFIEQPNRNDEQLSALFEGYARTIETPFAGAVISFRDQAVRLDTKTRILQLSREFPASRLAYIRYETWAGRVDFVAGFACRSGELIVGSERDSEAENETCDANEVLPALLEALGVRSPSFHFAPFERGYFPNT